MDVLYRKQQSLRIPAITLAAFFAFLLAFTLIKPASANERLVSTSWQKLVEKFSHMAEEKKLALLIAVNVRAENHHTLAVRREYERTKKINHLAEAKHSIEKAKILRQLSQHTSRTDFRQAFTAMVRSLKSYLRGEITRYDVNNTRDQNNDRFRKVLLSIKNKGAFMDIINRSQTEIALMGDTVYLMAKARARSSTALLN